MLFNKKSNKPMNQSAQILTVLHAKLSLVYSEVHSTLYNTLVVQDTLITIGIGTDRTEQTV